MCHPLGTLCNDNTVDAAGFKTMIITSTANNVLWDGIDAVYDANVKIAIALTGSQTVTLAGSTLSFSVPETTALTGFSFINVTSVGAGGSVTSGGAMTLRLGRIVPASVPLFAFPTATSANWLGLFASVSVSTTETCVVATGSPVYGEKVVDIGLSVRASSGAGCPTFLSSGGLSGGAIAGIVIGSIVGAALLVLLAIFLFRKLDFDSKRQLFSRTKIHAAESSVPM